MLIMWTGSWSMMFYPNTTAPPDSHFFANLVISLPFPYKRKSPELLLFNCHHIDSAMPTGGETLYFAKLLKIPEFRNEYCTLCRLWRPKF